MLNLYELYKVSPIQIPIEIPSTSEVIGYDIKWQDFNELKAYKIIDFLLRMRFNLSMDCDEELYCVQISKDGQWFSEDGETLKECIIKILMKSHNDLLKIHEQEIRNILEEDI